MAVGGMEDKLICPPPAGTPGIIDPSALRYGFIEVCFHLVYLFSTIRDVFNSINSSIVQNLNVGSLSHIL